MHVSICLWCTFYCRLLRDWNTLRIKVINNNTFKYVSEEFVNTLGGSPWRCLDETNISIYKPFKKRFRLFSDLWVPDFGRCLTSSPFLPIRPGKYVKCPIWKPLDVFYKLKQEFFYWSYKRSGELMSSLHTFLDT